MVLDEASYHTAADDGDDDNYRDSEDDEPQGEHAPELVSDSLPTRTIPPAFLVVFVRVVCRRGSVRGQSLRQILLGAGRRQVVGAGRGGGTASFFLQRYRASFDLWVVCVWESSIRGELFGMPIGTNDVLLLAVGSNTPLVAMAQPRESDRKGVTTACLWRICKDILRVHLIFVSGTPAVGSRRSEATLRGTSCGAGGAAKTKALWIHGVRMRRAVAFRLLDIRVCNRGRGGCTKTAS